MAIRDLVVKTKVDNKGLKKGAAAAKKSFKGMESAAGRMSKSMKNAIGGIGFGVLAAGIHKAMSAQSEQIDSINKLNQALANQGNFTASTSRSLQEYASSMQQVTTYGDEAILQVQAQLAAYGGTEEQIKRTTSAVLDMAAATGGDLKMAGDLMGKAMVGYTGTLSRYGIIIDQGLSKTEKFEAAVSQVEQRFSGQARLAAETYSGALKQMSNAAGDVMEAFGKLFGFMAGQGGKPFSGLIKALEWLVKFIGTDVILTIGEFRATFSEAMATMFEIGAKAFDVLANLPGEMGKKFQGYADTLKLAAADSRLFAEEQRVAAVQMAYSAGKTADITNGTKQLSDATKEVTEAEKKRLAELKKLNESIPKLEVEYRKANIALNETVMAMQDGTEGMAFFEAEAAHLEDTMSILGPSARQVSLDFSDFVADIKELGGVTALSDAQLLNVVAHMESLGEQTELTTKQWEAYGAAITEAAGRGLDETEAATTATVDWSKALQDVANQFQGMPGIIGNIASSIGNIVQQVAGIGASFKNLKGAFSAFKSGGGGFLDQLGGIAGMIPGIGGIIGGAVSLFGGIKSLFGGKSDEEKAAEESRKKAWEDLSATLEDQYGSLGELSDQAAKYGVDLSHAMDTKDAEAMNKELAELEKRQKGLKNAAAGISAVIENIKPTTEAGAMAQAGLFSTVFWATVEREGLIAASESLRGAFDTLMDGASESMKAFLAPIATQMSLAGNEAFAAAAEGAAGLAQAIRGMSDAGIVSIQDMTNAGQVAMDAYHQALNAAHQEGLVGAQAQEAAIRTVGPAVAAIRQQYEALGLPIDENTQALIGVAEANGMAFATDPMTRAAEAMEQVAVALGRAFGFAVDLGNAFGGVAAEANRAAGAASSIPTSGGGGRRGRNVGTDFTSAAKGMTPKVLGRDTIIQAHRGEGVMVVPKSQVGRGMGYASAAGGFSGGQSIGYTPGPRSTSKALVGGQQGMGIVNRPTIVVNDQSVIKTPEGVREFNKHTVEGLYKALDQNAQGLATRMEYQQRTRCRSRI